METRQILELGDSVGHEFHGNQWTGVPGEHLYPLAKGQHPGTWMVGGGGGKKKKLLCNIAAPGGTEPNPGVAIPPVSPLCPTDAQAQLILSTLTDLANRYPMDPPVYITIVDAAAAVAAGCPGATGYTSSDHVIHLVGGFPGVTNRGDGLETVLSHSLSIVGAARYVTMHEYGHAMEASGASAMYSKVMALPQAGGMSSYGRTNSSEAFAEAFADHVATGGTSTNVSTQAYSARFGWK